MTLDPPTRTPRITSIPDAWRSRRVARRACTPAVGGNAGPCGKSLSRLPAGNVVWIVFLSEDRIGVLCALQSFIKHFFQPVEMVSAS